MAKFYAVKVGKTTGIFTSWNECKASVDGFSRAKYKSFFTKEEAEAFLNENEVSDKSEKHSSKISNSDRSKKYVMFPTKETVKTTEEYDQIKQDAMSHLDALYSLDMINDSMYEKIKSSIDVSIRAKQSYQAIMEAREWKPYPDHADVFVDGSYNPETNEYGYGVYINDGEKEQIIYGRGNCLEGGRNIEGEVMGAKMAIQTLALNNHYKSITVYHDYQGIGSWADNEWTANKSYTKAYSRFVNNVREYNNIQITFKHVDGHTGVIGNEYVDKLAKIGCGIKLTQSEKDFINQLKDVPGFPKTNELPNENN